MQLFTKQIGSVLNLMVLISPDTAPHEQGISIGEITASDDKLYFKPREQSFSAETLHMVAEWLNFMNTAAEEVLDPQP